VHVSIIRIIADSTGGSRFADGVELLVPIDVAKRGHDGDRPRNASLPGEDWVAFVVE
jgi:hypothetical protein